MSATLAQMIATAKSAIAQRGQFTLTASTLDTLPLGNLLSLLELEQLQFDRIGGESETRLAILGQAAVLGAPGVEVEGSLGESSDAIALHLSVTGTIRARNATIANARFAVTQPTAGVVLHWSIAEIDLCTVSAVFLNDVALPAELPVLPFQDIVAQLAPSTGAFSLAVTAATTRAFPANGGDLTVSPAPLKLDRASRDSATHCAIALASTVGKDIVAGLHIDRFHLNFDSQGGDWSIPGNVHGGVLDAAVIWAAGYRHHTAGKSLTLSPEVEMEAVPIDDLGSLRLFSLNQNYLQLPPYLGGKTLSPPDDDPALTYADIAQGVNGMKTLSVHELMQAVPLSQRVGRTTVDFGPISGGLGWCVTTPDEFRTLSTAQKQLAYTQLNLANEAQARELFSVLPAAPTLPADPAAPGPVVFLRGYATVPHLASFETVFGLAASASLGCTTGFQMRGALSDVMQMELGGGVCVSGSANPVLSLTGRSTITWANQPRPVFQGDIQMTDQCFQCAGNLDIYGVGGAVMMQIDRRQGAEISGVLNSIDLPVFKLKHASVFLKIYPHQLPTLQATGAVELLGITSQTDVEIADGGFSFTTQGKLFNAFNATLTASGRRLTDTANFRIVAILQNDVTDSLKHEATQALKIAADQANQDLSSAQQKVAAAQQEVSRWNAEVKRQRAMVMGERRTANQKLQSALDDVDAAQRQVNRLNGEIAARQRRIAELTLGKVCKFGMGWESTGLGAALGTATAGLKTAQGVLQFAQKGGVNTPVDADPRVAGPLGCLATAQGTLQLANRALDGFKTIAQTTLQAGDFIASRGLDALLLVRSASFVAHINTAATGQVKMAVQLSYMDQPTAFAGDFNLKDSHSVQRLGQAIARKLLNP